MKKSDSTRLQKYMTAAAAVLGTTAAQAQYQYTDIADTTISGGEFGLDLDGDTIVDFTIEHILQGGQQGNVNAILLHPGDSLTGNLVMGSPIDGFFYVDKVSPGTILNDSLETFNGIGGPNNVGYMAFEVDGVAYPNSNWAGPLTDGYLGLRILKDDTACYGWVRIDVEDSTKSITIKDWSFNPVKDSSHTVAFELLDVMETVLKDMKVQQGKGWLRLTLGSAVPVDVLDAQGKLVARKEEGVAHAFDTSAWSSGMYILRLDGQNWHHNLKVLIP